MALVRMSLAITRSPLPLSFPSGSFQQIGDKKVHPRSSTTGSQIARHDLGNQLLPGLSQSPPDLDESVVALPYRRGLEADDLRLGLAHRHGLLCGGLAHRCEHPGVRLGVDVFDFASPSAFVTAAWALNSLIHTCRSESTTLACVFACARACSSCLRVSSASRCVSNVTLDCSATFRSVRVFINSLGGTMSPMRVSTADTLYSSRAA